MRHDTHVLDTPDLLERQRLALQTELWDPFTCGVLHKIGVDAGWRCLEIGGGTGSVASWLHQRVGNAGSVVVTDIDTLWLEPLAAPNLEVRRHDILADPLEPEAYDLVLARLVLMHLPERKAVLAKLAAAVRPGGWLVVADYDQRCFLDSYPYDPAFSAFSQAFSAAMESAGVDTAHGRKLPAALGSVGLVDIGVDGRVIPQRADEVARYAVPVFERLKDRILDTGIATEAEYDHVMETLLDGASSQWLLSPILFAARGRRSRAG
jgi:SAM-dependent methyltransferase